MRTVARFQPGFVSADTEKSVKQIPQGKMWLTLVTVEVVELDDTQTDLDTQFSILAALPSMETDVSKSNLLRRALLHTGQHIEANKGSI